MELEPSPPGEEAPAPPAPFTLAPRLGWSGALAWLRAPGTGWLLLFTATLFVSSALLFAVQPMVAKMLLPVLGGAPATWITSLLFFQSVLLAGYAYAHGTTRWLGSRRQTLVHAGLLALSLATLPIAIPHGWEPGRAANPLAWLLAVLVVSVGLPFFVVSSTGPLLQRWFTSTNHASARDPYFLFRASNLGSMLALLAYPALIEPRLRLSDQGRLWAAAYVGLAGLTVVCAVTRWRAPVEPGTGSPSEETARPFAPNTTRDAAGGARPVPAARRLRWVALAFVPSSFMLAVTTHITTDVAAVPLLWIIPLALYLLSFILAFSPRPSIVSPMLMQAKPFLLLQLVLLAVLRVTEPVVLVVVADVLALFVAALVCHARLAEDRPPSEGLTEFYLWIALGGALGGVFNAVVAPLAFNSVVEYPLAIVLAGLVAAPRQAPAEGRRSRRLDLLLPLGAGALFVAVAGVLRAVALAPFTARAVAAVAAVVVCAVLSPRSVRFGLAIGAVLVAAALPLEPANDTIFVQRTFFGVLRVDRDRAAQLHRLVHGTTVHGAQSTDPRRRLEPLSYYGPVGQVFSTLPGPGSTSDVAVIGLGTGSLACYGRPAQHWTFYEIDPAVERLARDPRLFTYLRDCPPRADVVLGDARRSLSGSSGKRFGVIVVDAFNSDAIPVHLLTREALALYLDRLADGGVIAVNVTNRYLDLRGVVADLARDAHLASLVRDGLHISKAEAQEGRAGSVWVVLARDGSQLAALRRDPTWKPLPVRPRSRVWTDDFSNLLGALKRE